MNVADAILLARARNDIWSDLSNDRFADGSHCRIFLTESIGRAAPPTDHLESLGAEGVLGTVAAGSDIRWDGREWRVLNLGDGSATVAIPGGGRVERLALDEFYRLVSDGAIVGTSRPRSEIDVYCEALSEAAGPEEVRAAQEKMRITTAYLERPGRGRRRTEAQQEAGPRHQFMGKPLRTVQYWCQIRAEAEARLGFGFLGFLEQRRSGPVGSRLLAQFEQIARQVIEAHALTLTGPSPTTAYNMFMASCRQHGIRVPDTPSFKWFKSRLEGKPKHERVEAQEGERAAYQYEPEFYAFHPGRPFPRHGNRPLHIVHVDSTLIEIELTCSRTGRALGRAWLHLAIDAFTRRVVGIALTFEPPSHRSSLLVLRDIVRRYGRLPDWIVHDNGSEFLNGAFAQACDLFGVHRICRPPSSPRFGAVIERLLETIQSEIIHAFEGNTRLMRDPRNVSSAVQPVRLRKWTLAGLLLAVDAWALDIYDTRDHPTLLESPRAAFRRGIEELGSRPFKTVPYNSTFQVLLLPEVGHGGTRIARQRGVKVNNRRFKHDLLSHPKVEGKPLRCREDPWDIRYVWVLVPLPDERRPGSRKHWVRAEHDPVHAVDRMSQRELQAESAELNQRQQLYSGGRKDRGASLGELLLSPEMAAHFELNRMRMAAETDVREWDWEIDGPRLTVASEPTEDAGVLEDWIEVER